MGNNRTLVLIAKAAKKLERLDPEYAARMHRDRRVRSDKRRRDELRAIAKEHDRIYAKVVRSPVSELAFDAKDDVQSVASQDAVLISLDRHMKATSSTRRLKPSQVRSNEPLIARANRVTANGETRTLLGWSQHTGLTIATIRNRLKHGWAPEQAVARKPIRAKMVKLHTFDGQSRTLKDWATVTGINAATLQTRLSQGWSLEEALTVTVGSRMGGQTHKRRKLAHRNRGWAPTSRNAAGTSGAASLDTETKQAFSESTEP